MKNVLDSLKDVRSKFIFITKVADNNSNLTFSSSLEQVGWVS
jgi:hypothetical protein